MKKFLFLDDTQERHDHFTNICKDLNVFVVHCKTALEAINAMFNMKFDCVFLDHDLEDTDPNSTGQTVAEFIALHLDHYKVPRNIIIHSWNPEGAKKMENVLKLANIQNVKRIQFSFKN
jgi:hypothetical protein